VQVVLFEGWMLGFQSLSPSDLLRNPQSTNIEPINTFLQEYQSLHHIFDCWMVLAVQDIAIVYQWRLQAEQQMRALGKPSLTDDQVQDFVQRFMPAYECYLPGLYQYGPERRRNVGGVPVFQVTVNEQRFPIRFETIDDDMKDEDRFKPPVSKL